MVVPEMIIDLDVCRLRNSQYVLTDHQASSHAAANQIVLLQRGVIYESLVIPSSQIPPSEHLAPVAVDFIAVFCVTVTVTLISVTAAVILNQGVRIGPTYAALRV
jgi:hypothetical protein